MTDTDNSSKSIVYNFGEYQLDVDRQELRHAGESVAVQRKVLEILLFLISNRHRAVSKDELQDAVWPDTVVAETSLTRAILKARRAINDDAQQQSLIKTLHGHGYRFVGEVAEQRNENVAAESAAFDTVEAGVAQDHPPVAEAAGNSIFAEWLRSGVLRRVAVAAGVLVLVIGGQFAYQTLRDNPTGAGQSATQNASAPATSALAAANHSIAVLPFVNMSADKDHEYFADGLSEELLNLLAKTRDLQVAARTSAFSYKGKNADIRRIGADLNVAHVLEGSVRWSGERVRITAQLIAVDSGYHLWSETYNRTLNDIFLVQDEIAAAVVDALKVTLLGGKAPEPPRVAATVDPEAYTLYLQGRYLYRQSTAAAYKQAVKLLKQCLEIDANYAPAWDTLGMVYTRQADHGILPIDSGYTQARAAVEKAVAIDPNLAEAHAHLSWIAMNHGWNLAEADRHAKRALALAPGSYTVLAQAATLAFVLDRLDESIAMREHALSRDPVSRGGHHNLATAYYYAGRPVPAETMYRKALGLSPGYLAGQFYLGLTLLAQGKSAAALAAFEQEQDEGWRLEGLALANHALGKPDEAAAALDELHTRFASDMAYQIAEIHGYRGELDAAFDWLERAYAQRDGGLLDMKNNPLLVKLHADPRWQKMLRKMGLA